VKVHYLQHVAFEGLSSIAPYVLEKGHALSSTRLFEGEALPSVDELDCLIVMGGPMGIFDHVEYPWLETEKTFIKEAIDEGKVVLGICLGAQLIADVLGAEVYKNEDKEIGWFDIYRPAEIKGTIVDSAFPEKLEVFHWHGDTFDIPKGAQLLASSEACLHQGFVFEDRVVALQFHLETTADSAAALIEHCANDLDGSRFVQNKEEMLQDEVRFVHINQVMSQLLKCLGL